MANLITEIKGSRGREIKIYDTKCEIKTRVTLGSVLTQNATDGVKTIYLCDVTGVQFKRSGLAIGYLQFETGSMQMNNKSSNFFSENTFTFEDGRNNITNDFMEKVYNYVVERIEEIKYGVNIITCDPDLYIKQDEETYVEEVADEFVENEIEFSEDYPGGISNDPNEFYNEIKNTSTEDLKLILNDQRELFSDEEIKMIEQEMSRRMNG